MGLQSGFVLAVILAAVLAAGRLGGSDEVGKRLFQVGLAVAIAFATIGGAEAFIRSPGFDEASAILESGFDESAEEEQYEALEDMVDRASLRRMIDFAAGIAALVLGLSALRRAPVTGLGVALGGVLLVVFGAGMSSTGDSTDPLSSFYGALGTIFTSALGQPSRLVDISEFVVMCAGALALAFIGLRTWDVEQDAPAPAARDDAALL